MTDGDRRNATRLRAVVCLSVLALTVGGGVVIVTQQPSTDPAAERGASFPPGVSSSGIENVSRLVEAHRTALRSAGAYRVEHIINASRPPGHPRPDRWKWNQTARHRFALRAEPPRFRQWRQISQPAARTRLQVFATPTVWHVRTQSADGGWDGRGHARDLAASAFKRWAVDHSLEAKLAPFEFEVTGRNTRTNTTVYRLTSTGFRGDRRQGPRSLPNVIESATATLVVDEHGAIRLLETRYAGVAVASAERVRVPVRVRSRWVFDTASDVAVREPDWVNVDETAGPGGPQSSP